MKVAVLVPCFKRPEYTKRCVEALEQAQTYRDTTFLLVDDASPDSTDKILESSTLPKLAILHDRNRGLRNILIDFIEWATSESFDILGVIGNDCLVPKDWLIDILSAFAMTDADILSPNVSPSNAAYIYGRPDTEGLGYRPSTIVGGLWFMRRSMVEGIKFERLDLSGIKGAFNVLERIYFEKDPKIGWLPEVTVQDLGHWSGDHPEHIKSDEHRQYYAEVGRRVAW